MYQEDAAMEKTDGAKAPVEDDGYNQSNSPSSRFYKVRSLDGVLFMEPLCFCSPWSCYDCMRHQQMYCQIALRWRTSCVVII